MRMKLATRATYEAEVSVYRLADDLFIRMEKMKIFFVKGDLSQLISN